MKISDFRTFIILVVFISFCNNVFSQDTQSKEYYFYFLNKQKTDLSEVSRIVSIDNVISDTVFCYASEVQMEAFQKVISEYKILPHPGIQPEAIMSEGISSKDLWNTYPTYEGYVAMMEDYANTFPTMCSLVSFDTLSSGRELLAINIHNGASASSDVRPKVFFTSTMHGDETVGYVLMLRLIDSLLTGYNNSSEIAFLVDSLNIWINPNANPDGTYWSGNHTVSGARRYNSNFVDLNRNYPDPQDGPHPDGNPWQEETIAFMDFAGERGFDLSVNIHGGAEVCNYPWDTWPKLTADDLWWQMVCNEYADTAQYYSPGGYLDDFGTGVTNGYQWYTTNGCRQDYMNWFQQCREFTLELSKYKNPASSTLPDYWEYNRRSFLNYMKQAYYGVHGIVTDSVSGDPLKAKVFISGHDVDSSWVFSDPDNGDFHRYLKSGTWQITFSAAGYISKTVSVTLADATRENVSVQLVPENWVPVVSHTITFPEGWSGFSTWVQPENDSTEVIFGPVADTLIILKNLTDVYWPPYANNLPHISPNNGYALKMTHETSVTFTGNTPETTTVSIPQGWSYLPVMVADSISSAVLFNEIIDRIIIVKSFNGDQIFWPETGINTMEYLYSGRSYLIKVDENCTVTF